MDQRLCPNVIEAARDLRAAGIRVCRLDAEEKRPKDLDWPLRSADPEAFQDGDNLGIVLGPMTAGNSVLAGVDLDGVDPALADQFLPATGMVEGRDGSPASHRYFLVRVPDSGWHDCILPKSGKTRQAMDAGTLPRCPGGRTYRGRDGRLVELKLAGQQMAAPPSVHGDSGQRRAWVDGVRGEPAVIEYDALVDACEELAETIGWQPRRPEAVPVLSQGAFSGDQAARGVERACAYLRTMGPAVEGHGGDHQTFRACLSALDFVTNYADGWAVVEEWNWTCAPPWSDRALLRKFNDAIDFRENPVGCKLTDGRTYDEEAIVILDDEEAGRPLDDADWPPLIPLEVAHPMEIPVDALGVLAPMVREVARAIEAPVELAIGMGLTVVSGAAAYAYHYETPGYREPLMVWTASAEHSGGRKTAVKALMAGPVYDYEREMAAQHAAQRHRREAQAGVLRDQAKALRDEARQADPEGALALADRIAELEARAEEIETPSPRLVVEDVTAEKVGAMLADHGECLMLLSDEAGPFDNFGGRYRDRGAPPNLDVWLQAHAGAPVRVDRGSRPSVQLHHPRLAVGLMPQPCVIQELIAKEGFKGRGMLARFVFLLGQTRIGSRRFNQAPVDPAVKDQYERLLFRLLEAEPGIDGAGRVTTKPLRPTRVAHQVWLDYCTANEGRLAVGGDLHHMKDWGSKSTGLVLRVAGTLHAAECEHPEEEAISKERMGRAVALVKAFTEHAKAAFATMKADPDLTVACDIWELTTGAPDRVAYRDGDRVLVRGRAVGQALRGRYKEKLLAPGWALLVESGYLRDVTDQEHNGKAGRPSKVFEVRPGFEHFEHLSQDGDGPETGETRVA